MRIPYEKNSLVHWMYPNDENSYAPGVDRDIYDLRHWMYPDQGIPEFQLPEQEHSWEDLRYSDVGIAIYGSAIQDAEALGEHARSEWDNTWADYGADPSWDQ